MGTEREGEGVEDRGEVDGRGRGGQEMSMGVVECE